MSKEELKKERREVDIWPILAEQMWRATDFTKDLDCS
jgi:hypothetical protein